jgi:hypothetical protein
VWCKVRAYEVLDCHGEYPVRPEGPQHPALNVGNLGRRKKAKWMRRRGAAAHLEHEEVPGLLVQATHLVHGQALHQ